MTSTPAHEPSQDPIIIGAAPAAALVIGLGYGSIAWGIYADSNWLGFVSIFLGGVGLEMARVPWQGKYAWHGAGILFLGLAGTMLGTFLLHPATGITRAHGVGHSVPPRRASVHALPLGAQTPAGAPTLHRQAQQVARKYTKDARPTPLPQGRKVGRASAPLNCL